MACPGGDILFCFVLILAARYVEAVLYGEKRLRIPGGHKVFKVAQGKVAGDGDDHFLCLMGVCPESRYDCGPASVGNDGLADFLPFPGDDEYGLVPVGQSLDKIRGVGGDEKPECRIR